MSISGIDIEGKHVVLRESAMAEDWRDITWRTVLASGGFGCSPDTIGSAVFAEHVRDGEQARWERGQIERLATDKEVSAAKALRLT
jgi:hypothetical protein